MRFIEWLHHTMNKHCITHYLTSHYPLFPSLSPSRIPILVAFSQSLHTQSSHAHSYTHTPCNQVLFSLIYSRLKITVMIRVQFNQFILLFLYLYSTIHYIFTIHMHCIQLQSVHSMHRKYV